MSENYTAEDFAQEKAGLDRQGLVDHIQELDAVTRRRNKEVKELRVARDELRKIVDELHAEIRGLQAAPLSLDTLAAAWEAAEVPTDDAPMRQGDVYISTVDRNDRGLGYLVAAAGRNGTHMHFNARILSRAPREPWVELAGVLHDVINQGGDDHIDVDSAAARLYAEGVRVTGGDEK